MSAQQPSGFVRIDQTDRGPVARSQIRGADGRQKVSRIGLVHAVRTADGWEAVRSRPPAGVMTLAEAQAELVRRLSDATSGTTHEPTAVTTFDEAVAVWLEHTAAVDKRRASTVRDYASIARVHLLPAFTGRALAAITRLDVQAFADGLARAERPLSPRTRQKVLIALSRVFKIAERNGLLAAGAAPRCGKPSVRPGEVLFFTMGEVEAIAEAAGEMGGLVRVAALTGLRRGELCALRWRDVDFDGGLLHVRRSFVEGVETAPKSHEVRELPLHPDASVILAGVSLVGSGDPGDLVFPGTAGGYMNPDNLSKGFTAAMRVAGIAAHGRSFKSLRSTFATHLGDTPGLTVLDVQAALGHSDLKTTQRYLGRLTKADAAERMGGHFGLPAAPTAVVAVSS